MGGQLTISPTKTGILGDKSAGAAGDLTLKTGSAAVTTTNAVSTGLTTIVSAGMSRQTTPAATNAFESLAYSGGTLTLSAWESDFTVGTTAATFDWWAIGY